MNLNDELRQMMTTRADEAPDGATLLDGVRRRSDRLDRRRRILTVATAVIVAAAIAVGTPLALGSRRGSGPIGGTPTPTVPGPSGLALAPPTYVLPVFPFTPGYTSDKLTGQWVGISGEVLLLGYDQSEGLLLVQVSPRPFTDQLPAGQTRTTAVGSATATMRTGTSNDGGQSRQFAELSWRLADGRWISVMSVNLLSAAEVEAYARALRPGPVAATHPPYRLALVPRDWVLAELFTANLCLAPSAEQAGTVRLCLSWSDMSLGGGEALTVAGHPAELVDGATYLELRVSLGPGNTAILAADKTSGLTRDDLIRIAEGLTIA
jgi:hypothetical protein